MRGHTPSGLEQAFKARLLWVPVLALPLIAVGQISSCGSYFYCFAVFFPLCFWGCLLTKIQWIFICGDFKSLDWCILPETTCAPTSSAWDHFLTLDLTNRTPELNSCTFWPQIIRGPWPHYSEAKQASFLEKVFFCWEVNFFILIFSNCPFC